MRTHKYLPWAIVSGVAIVAAVLSTNSNKRSNTDRAPSEAIHASFDPITSEKNGWVRDLVSESGFEPPLTNVQQEQLMSQCESIMAVYEEGGSIEFLELMDSWGGWLREGYEDEIVHNRWTQAPSKFPWASIDKKQWGIGRPERMPENGAIDHSSDEYDGMMAVQNSLFDFGDDRKTLNLDYDALVAFEGPVRSIDGSQTYVHMQFVWSPSLNRWLPSALVHLAPKGDSLPRIVF